MEEEVGMVATAPAIPRDLSSSQECWVWGGGREPGEEEHRGTRQW